MRYCCGSSLCFSAVIRPVNLSRPILRKYNELGISTVASSFIQVLEKFEKFSIVEVMIASKLRPYSKNWQRTLTYFITTLIQD